MKKILSSIFVLLAVLFSLSALSVKKCDGVEQIVDHNYFIVGYDEDTECALYVEYVLDEEETAKLGSVKRKDHFRADKEIVTNSSHPSDYAKSGYDMGHLFPFYQASFDAEVGDLSFLMSNMCPQGPYMNRTAWRLYEESIVDIAREYGDVERVCGPIFFKDVDPKYIGKNNRVRVPEAFYSAISYVKDDTVVIECIIMTNGRVKADVKTYSVSIEEVEHLTGIEFDY